MKPLSKKFKIKLVLMQIFIIVIIILSFKFKIINSNEIIWSIIGFIFADILILYFILKHHSIINLDTGKITKIKE